MAEPAKEDKEAELPYKKCKNFAERLMRVLQHGIGTDTIWWVGEVRDIFCDKSYLLIRTNTQKLLILRARRLPFTLAI